MRLFLDKQLTAAFSCPKSDQIPFEASGSFAGKRNVGSDPVMLTQQYFIFCLISCLVRFMSLVEAGADHLWLCVYGCVCIHTQQFHIHGKTEIQALPFRGPKTLHLERKKELGCSVYSLWGKIFFFLCFSVIHCWIWLNFRSSYALLFLFIVCLSCHVLWKLQ